MPVRVPVLLALAACAGEPAPAPVVSAPPCRKVGFACGEGHPDPLVNRVLDAVKADPAGIEALAPILREGGLDEAQRNLAADVAGHVFAFDLTDPEREAARAEVAIEDGLHRAVFLRGLFMQYGYDHASDPAACQAYLARVPALAEREKAFGLANGMVWGLRALDAEGAEPDWALLLRTGQPLQGMLRDLYFEEFGWQHNAWRRSRGEAVRVDLASLAPEPDVCAAIHGYVRAATEGGATLGEAQGWAERAPPACRLHALHAAQRRSCVTPSERAPDPGMPVRCGILPEDLGGWAGLDAMP